MEELHKALTSMQGGKSPGIDGLPKEFYVAFWQLVGKDLNQVLQGSIEQGELPLSMRRAVISPIFKKGDKTLLENWRPISLLNTDYNLNPPKSVDEPSERSDHFSCGTRSDGFYTRASDPN